jgi:hypothetical protein
MNRLAQAFACLLEPLAKQQYDSSLLLEKTESSRHSESDTVIQSLSPLETWSGSPATAAREQNGKAGLVVTPPPPVPTVPPPLPESSPRVPPPLPVEHIAPMPPLPPARDASPTMVLTPTLARSAASTQTMERVDPIQEAARSTEAQFGLGTRAAILRRLRLTRRLIHHWKRVGKFVSMPQRRLRRQSAANELDVELSLVMKLLRDFPPILGQAGQPGYQVATLSTMHLLVTFQNMDFSQRQQLSLDWHAGRKLLIAHGRFVRQRGRDLRNATPWQRLWRGVSALLFGRPGFVLLVLGLVALTLALWQTFWSPAQLNPRL